MDEAKAAYDRVDYATSFRLFLPLANEGNEDAQLTIGWFYAYGHGTKQNCAEAVRWYEKLTIKNSRRAQFQMGTVFEVPACGNIGLKRLEIRECWQISTSEVTNDQEFARQVSLDSGCLS
jgi:hypothetical protein